MEHVSILQQNWTLFLVLKFPYFFEPLQCLIFNTDLSVDIPVVSIAKPHRKKRKPSKAKPKSKAKSKSKKQPPKSEDNTESTLASSQSNSTEGDSENNNNNNNTTSDNNNNSDQTLKEAPTTTPNTTTPTTSTPPTSSTSDSDTDQGPLSCHLTDCLESFIKEETVEGYLCNSCKEKSTATKRLFIHTLPNVLCVVLKRFCWTSTSRAKIDTHVTIPFTLDITDFMTPISTNTNNKDTDEKDKTETKDKPPHKTRGQYELRSVVMHHGVGLLSGHYTSFCYNELQDTWVHYNDARVTLVTRDHVEKETPSQAYLMFFQRTFPPPSPMLLPLLPSVPPLPVRSLSPPASPYNPPSSPSSPPSSNATTSKAKRPRKR